MFNTLAVTWLDHSDQGQMSLDDKGDVYHFLQRYCPYWLELMSIVGKLAEAMAMMMNVESLVIERSASIDVHFHPRYQSTGADARNSRSGENGY